MMTMIYIVFFFCLFVCLFLYLLYEKVVCFYCEVGKTYIKARVRFESVFS